jgi:hypothetical protein
MGEVLTGMERQGGHDRTISDAEVTTTCEACGTHQALSEARLEQSNDDSVYYCKQGCEKPIAAVLASSDQITVDSGAGLTVEAP